MEPLTRIPSQREPHRFALLGAFFGCALIWGSTFLVISIGNDSVPAQWAAALRLAFAAPLLALITVVTRHELPRGRALRAAGYYGFFNLGIGLSLLYWAELRVPSGLAAVIYATIPLTSTFLTRAFGLERMTWIKIVAAVIALAGVAVIFSGQLREAVPALPLIGLFAAATVAGFGTVLLKRGPRQNPFGANAVGASVGCIFCLIASLVAGERHPFPATTPELLPILYLAIAGSIGAYVLLAWLVNHWDVTRISFVSVIIPVIAILLGSVFRGERLTPTSLAGSVLVLIGVLISIYGERLRAGAHSPIAETPAGDAHTQRL